MCRMRLCVSLLAVSYSWHERGTRFYPDLHIGLDSDDIDSFLLSQKSTVDYYDERAPRTCRSVRGNNAEGDVMIVLGIILLILGWLLGIGILWTLGIILIVIGVILELLGAVGRPVLGRRHYY
jgi:hypothetical protein